MTPSHHWEQWTGTGYLSEKLNPVIYYYPGKVDIEVSELRDELAAEIQMDGITPDKRTAHGILESAIVVHGQVATMHGELSVYEGYSSEDYFSAVHDATWVELDEYTD